MNASWRISSAAFVLVVALQTKFLLFSWFSRNLANMPMTSALVRSTSKKHTTNSNEISYGKDCRSTVLTTACYWVVCHCIPSQKFVSVPATSPLSTAGFRLRQWCVLSVVTTPVQSLHATDGQSQPSRRGCHCWRLQDQPSAFCGGFVVEVRTERLIHRLE